MNNPPETEVVEQTKINPLIAEGKPEGCTALDSCLLLVPFGAIINTNPKSQLSIITSIQNPHLPDTVIIHPNLSANRLTINAETGEELSQELGQTSFRHNGATTFYRHFQGGQYTIRGRGITQPVISVTINSKLLNRNYYSGIMLSNVEQVYQSVIAQSIINCSLETFLESKVVDVDIKQDYVIEPLFYKSIINQMKLSVKEKYQLTARVFNSNNNHGLQIGNRREISQPLLKLYNKAIEITLMDNSEFYEKALHFNCLPNLKRLECTFSNLAQLRRFKLLDESESNTLRNVLSGIDANGLESLKLVIHHYVNQIVPGVSNMTVKTKGEDKATRLQRRIARIVKLCLDQSLSEHETIVEVIGIIDPGINYHSQVKRITRCEYERQLNHAPIPIALDFLFNNYQQPIRR